MCLFLYSLGRMHDARVFRNSTLYMTGRMKTRAGQFHLIEDAAYPCLPWLMTPFKDFGNLTVQQNVYNTEQSVRRQTVERTFGMLKQRFRRIKLGVDMRDIGEINKLILACCILHNLCIIGDSDARFDDEDDEDPANPVLQPVPNVVAPRINRDGQAKRRIIVDNL